MWWILGLVLGTAEVALVTWLVLGALDGDGWLIAGYVAYSLYCLMSDGGDLKKLVLITLLALALIFITTNFGFIAAAVLYVAMIVIWEFVPRKEE